MDDAATGDAPRPESTTVVTSSDLGDATLLVVDDGKANALGPVTVPPLRRAFAAACTRELPVVLAGRPGCFSGGMDLRVMTSGDGDAITRMLLDTTDLLCDIVQARVPVVAACTGHAVAGGAVLLLATDLRVGAPGDHRFGFNEVAAGFAMPDVGLLFARHRLTPSAALHSLLFSALVDPQRALSDGYLDEVADDPVARAVERARTAAAFDSYAFAHTKERLNGALVAALGDARARIQSESAAVVLDPGHRTGA